jgi:hypothetical protein
LPPPFAHFRGSSVSFIFQFEQPAPHVTLHPVRRHWKTFVLVLGSVAIVACVLFAVFSGEQEPSYGGHPLTAWLVADREKETDALSHLGTNALPFLVKRACAPQSKWRVSLSQFCAAHLKMFPKALVDWHNRDIVRAENAVRALGLMRTNAYPALARLNSLASSHQNPTVGYQADRCITGILYGYPPTLSPRMEELEQKAFVDQDPNIRLAATNAHRYILGSLYQ